MMTALLKAHLLLYVNNTFNYNILEKHHRFLKKDIMIATNDRNTTDVLLLLH